MKIAYLDSKIHTGSSAMYMHYDGLFDELSKVAECCLISEQVTSYDEIVKLSGFLPDGVMFGIGWEHWGLIKGMDKFNVPVLMQMYKPQNELKVKLNFCVQNYVDLIITSVPSCKFYFAETGIPCSRMCYAAHSDIFYDRKFKKEYDIGFSGALHQAKLYRDGVYTDHNSNIRSRIGDLIKSSQLNHFFNGSDSVKARIKSYHAYAETISKSKIWIATEGPCGDITPRYFEVPMSGTLLVCNEVDQDYGDLLIDNKTCIIFKNDLSDFMDKINYYVEHWDETQKIIDYSYSLFHNQHTYAHRAVELLDFFRTTPKKQTT